MYIYQNGKLYAQLGDNKIVGVEIYSDKIVRLKGTECELFGKFSMLTLNEVKAKFNLTPYITPVEVAPKKVISIPKSEPIITIESIVPSTPKRTYTKRAVDVDKSSKEKNEPTRKTKSTSTRSKSSK